MKAEASLIRVGDGRGFVVADMRLEELFIITAAHCIPEMPPAHLGRYLHEETFPLLGPLLKGKPHVFATVLFYDPIGDVAVLGPPDGQAMYDDASAYRKLLARYKPLAIAIPRNQGKGFVYDLKGKPQQITYRCWQGPFKAAWLHVEGYVFEGGMSGSPVLDSRGRALALVSTSGNGSNLASPCLSAAIPSRIRLNIKPITGGAKRPKSTTNEEHNYEQSRQDI